jgi:H+/Cl- antiporter ClcA
MAGILSGLFHAPLTIFLIAEITGGYNLMTLMIVASISFATI